jgi:nicotinate-nucleotide adenylyltransferase
MSNAGMAPLAVLGGTFDPVHYGHLRPAIEIRESLGASELRLIPGHVPPHRPQPRLAASRRAELLDRAVAPVPGLVVDRRELARAGPSYSLDTLRDLRRVIGARRPLCFVMGDDAFGGLCRWYQWHRLTDYAHLVVTTRAGDTALPATGPRDAPSQWLPDRQAHTVQALRSQPAGLVYFHPVSRLEISATAIRRLLAQGRSAQGLMPDCVWQTVADRGLYGYPQV